MSATVCGLVGCAPPAGAAGGFQMPAVLGNSDACTCQPAPQRVPFMPMNSDAWCQGRGVCVCVCVCVCTQADACLGLTRTGRSASLACGLLAACNIQMNAVNGRISKSAVCGRISESGCATMTTLCPQGKTSSPGTNLWAATLLPPYSRCLRKRGGMHLDR